MNTIAGGLRTRWWTIPRHDAAGGTLPGIRDSCATPVGLLDHVSARFAAGRLDDRLATGEEPSSSGSLTLRSTRLESRRLRRQLARGLDRASSESQRRAVFSAAVPVDREAATVARPALQQLARALRERRRVQARGVALTHILLTSLGSPLYGSRYPDELYEHARAALLALGPDAPAGAPDAREGCSL